MKEHIDRVIREQLGTYELPYDPGAWEAFSQKLGPAMTTTSTPFYRNWWFAASVVTALVATATWLGLSTEGPTADSTVVAATEGKETTTVSGDQKIDGGKVQSVTTTVDQTATAGTISGIVSDPGSAPANGPIGTQSAAVNTGSNGSNPNNVAAKVDDNHVTKPGGDNKGQTVVTPGVTEINRPIIKALIIPVEVCMNDPFTLENPNSIDAWVTLPSGKKTRVSPNKSTTVEPKQAGTITITCGDQKQSIAVNAPKDITIRATEALIEDGVPVVRFEVSGTKNDVEWRAQDIRAKSVSEDGRVFTVNPYTENEVTVRAISTDNNGCVVSDKVTVPTDKVANLVTVKSFTPQGNISKNSGFMPYLLTQRDTPFKLTIYDPTQGMQVVFSTTDASEGWTGIDDRTGQMAKSGVAYYWKVEMKRHLPSEPPVYQGTVVLNN